MTYLRRKYGRVFITFYSFNTNSNQALTLEKQRALWYP